jgi:hypothetical protein
MALTPVLVELQAFHLLYPSSTNPNSLMKFQLSTNFEFIFMHSSQCSLYVPSFNKWTKVFANYSDLIWMSQWYLFLYFLDTRKLVNQIKFK